MGKKRDNAWMAFYPGDYLRDTMHLSAEQHGAYLLLLLHAWMNDGRFEDDDEQLANITRLSAEKWAKSRRVLVAFFTQEDGRLSHGRIVAERQKAVAVTEERSKAGKEGAQNRWHRNGKKKHLPDSQDGDVQQDSLPDGKEVVGASPTPPTPPAPEPDPAPPPPAPPAPAAEPPSAPRGCRLPEDWTAPPEWLEVAEALRPELNALETADSFRDYWVAKPGKDGVKLDWLATWRNWVRNQRARGAVSPTTRDQRAATLNGLGTPYTPGEKHGTDRKEFVDVQARVIPDVD